MTRTYALLCRFCSDPIYPDFKFFYADGDSIICSNCGAILQEIPHGGTSKYTELEVVDDGRTS